jgi:dienelactone hydrolase
MRLHLFLLLALPGFAQTLYEEDIAATKGNRDNNWRQLTAYIDRLETSDPRANFARQMGFPAPGLALRGTPRIEKAGEDELGSYQRVWIPVGENIDAHGLLLLPAGRKGRVPLVIAQHGGGGTPELALFRGGSNYHDMIRGALREGYAVWAPLIVMYPFVDRDHGSAIPSTVREDLDQRLRFLGTTLFSVEITKLKLALDYLLKRPEIDPARVAFIGLSYGGFYAAYAAALEPRIKVVVASCSLRPWSGNDPEVWKPTGRPTLRPLELIWNLVSPRPVQLQAGKEDKLLPLEGAREVVEKTRPAWSANPSNFDYQEFDGSHEWRGAIAWPFLRTHLK